MLAWHDMLIQASMQELAAFRVTDLVEPVLWSYAEDLDQYLSPATWMALKVSWKSCIDVLFNNLSFRKLTMS